MNPRLYRYSQFTVLAAFALILIGSLVTTKGAGMAFADWPLSSNSLNPEGWWSHLLQRLEHGHRLFAEFTGLLIGILCAWVWGSRWACPGAFLVSATLSLGASMIGIAPRWIALVGLGSAAVVFIGILLYGNRSSIPVRSSLSRWLSFAAFSGVLFQALLGGLRVTIESSGHFEQAMVIRIFHGCFAQIEFCLLVALASTLSPKNFADTPVPALFKIQRLAWLTFAFAFIQLTLGASIRHLGIALVIPTFPLASLHSLLPPVSNFYADLHFFHSRIIAFLVALHILLLGLNVFRSASFEVRLRRPAVVLIGLLIAQIMFGISIIWTHRNPCPTTLHVLNGAALLATSFLIALRASCLKPLPHQIEGDPASFQPGTLS